MQQNLVNLFLKCYYVKSLSLADFLIFCLPLRLAHKIRLNTNQTMMGGSLDYLTWWWPDLPHCFGQMHRKLSAGLFVFLWWNTRPQGVVERFDVTKFLREVFRIDAVDFVSPLPVSRLTFPTAIINCFASVAPLQEGIISELSHACIYNKHKHVPL